LINIHIDLENKLEEDAPKCEFYDKVLQAQDLMPRTGIHTEVRPKCRKDSAVCAVPTYFLTREIIGNMAVML